MANYLIGLTIQYPSGTNLSDVKVYTRVESTNEQTSLLTNVDGQAIFNLGDESVFPSGWILGDKFSYFVLSSGFETYGSHTIAASDEGGYTATVVLSLLPTAPSIRYYTPQEFLDFLDMKIYEDDAENGIKLQRLVKIAQTVEKEIDSDCNTVFDSNSGSYYSQTDYFDDNVYFRVFVPSKRPIYLISSLNYNTARDGSADSWDTVGLTENTEYTKNPLTDAVRISKSSTKMPEDSRPRGWKLIYTYGRSSVPYDIKLLSIYETAIRLGYSAILKSKIIDRNTIAGDFADWMRDYRTKIINRYRYQTFVNT